MNSNQTAGQKTGSLTSALRRTSATIALGAVVAAAGTATAGEASAATHTAKSTTVSASGITMNYGGLFSASNTDRVRTGEDHLWFKISWSSLEPSNGTYNWSAIDNQLKASPTVKIRIHVNGGPSTPAWLKTSAGSVNVSNSKDGVTANVGKYWTPTYMAAYSAFVTAMGARYDKNAATYDPNHLVASINNAGNSLVYDEPWIMGGTSAAATLFSAGLNKATAQAAQTNALAALTAAFPTTVVEMPLHGQWTYPVSGGQAGTWTDGRTLVNNWDALYGSHVIFTDYGLGAGEYAAAAPSLATATSEYSWMHERADLGRPIGFQATLVSGAAGSANPTAAVAADACQAAVDMGASWFEHSSWSLLSTTQAQGFDTGLKASVG